MGINGINCSSKAPHADYNPNENESRGQSSCSMENRGSPWTQRTWRTINRADQEVLLCHVTRVHLSLCISSSHEIFSGIPSSCLYHMTSNSFPVSVPINLNQFLGQREASSIPAFSQLPEKFSAILHWNMVSTSSQSPFS